MPRWVRHRFQSGRNDLFVGRLTAPSPYSDGFLLASPYSDGISISLAALQRTTGFLSAFEAFSVISVPVWENEVSRS